MKRNRDFFCRTMAVAVLLLCTTGIARAQGSQSQPAPQPSDKSKTPEITPLSLDAAAPVSADEDAAYKAFHDIPPADMKKKVEMGEAFLLKYPQSRYKSPVYVGLTFGYLEIGQVPKMVEYGEKE